MPRGTASDEHDVVCIQKLFLVLHNATQTHRIVLRKQTATHGVAHDSRLLVDFLHHEVVEASLFDAVEVYLQLLNVGNGLHILYRLDMQFLAQLDSDHLFVFKVHHFLGATYDRRGIRSDEILALANADDHRTSLSSGNQLVGMAFLHDGDGIGTHHVVQGDAHGLKQVDVLALLHILDEVGQHLGIGGRLEAKATLFQFLTKAQIVFDDAVVNQGKVA